MSLTSNIFKVNKNLNSFFGFHLPLNDPLHHYYTKNLLFARRFFKLIFFWTSRGRSKCCTKVFQVAPSIDCHSKYTVQHRTGYHFQVAT